MAHTVSGLNRLLAPAGVEVVRAQVRNAKTGRARFRGYQAQQRGSFLPIGYEPTLERLYERVLVPILREHGIEG